MLRFVVLDHDSPRGLHWDFMLERGAALRTWSLSSPPGSEPETSAELLADHRLAYLDYEGPVAGNRGSVRRWDCGAYTVVEWSDTKIVVALDSPKLQGAAEFILQTPDASGGPPAAQRWLLRFISASSA